MQDPSNLAEAARRRRAVALAGHAADELTARAALDDEAGSVRATALGALRRMERLTADDIRAALADSDSVVRRRACQVADRMSDVDLLPLLDDADPTVAETAAWALGEQERDDAETVSALSAMARHHDDPLCRESAVAALGAIGHPDGLAAILAATKDKPAVRRRAVLALAPFEGPEVDAALEAALTDRDWQVRQAAEDLRTTEP